MAKIKVVHGAPCSGKTTFVREHAGANDLVWDYDSIRQALTLAGDHSRGTDAQNNMVLNLRQAYALSAADSEAETAWFICTRPSRAIEEALGEAEYIHMDATKEECLARLEADDTRPDKEFMQGLIEDYFEEARGMPSNEREYRNMEMRILPTEEGQEPSFFVEGHASTFEPYVLMTRDGVDYSERIEPHAFDGADLSDVVFRVDHQGRVYARSSAGSLEVWTDEHGLAQRADLGRTRMARDLYADIEAGNYPQMSFAFSVAEDHYDKATHTRIIDKIAKVFDVSPCAFVANPTTDLCVSTRAYFDGVIEAEKAERLEREERERQKQKIRILTEV